jgi:succinyl-diaminopimelate desuccinylase
MDYDQVIDGLTDEIIESTQALIKIKSVKSNSSEGKPFGERINDALEFALNLSEKFGFKTANLDGYIGYAEYGEGDKLIGILVHLDVVPEGEGWSSPPYEGKVSNGNIYGRGAIDDKGPAIAALYALKAIKDSGIKLNSRVRIIFGLNEESGSSCIQHYLNNDEIPSFSFVPDANYPVINGEKGILTFNLEKALIQDYNNIVVTSICGGNRHNMLPDFCEATLKVHDDSFLIIKEKFILFFNKTQFDMQLDFSSECILIKSFGVSAHASLPEKGVNAISRLMLFLNELDITGDLGDFITFYCKHIGLEYSGTSFGCNLSDDISGSLTLNAGIINVTTNKAEIIIDIRYPVTYTSDIVITKVKEKTDPFKISITNVHDVKPLYLPLESELVSCLMDVYSEFTGQRIEPVSIGGGTYARSMPNSVAFGPLFPNDPELAHQKDEYITVNNLIKNTKIYARAINKLAN